MRQPRHVVVGDAQEMWVIQDNPCAIVKLTPSSLRSSFENF